MAKTSQRQIVAYIEVPEGSPEGQPGMGANTDGTKYFTNATGGEITAAVEKVYDGGQRFPEVLCATADIGDVTLTRHYDPTRDAPFLAAIRHLVGTAYYDVTFQELNCDLINAANMRQYNNALLVGVTEPDGDASSGAPASFSLTFSIGPISTLTSTEGSDTTSV